MRLAHLCRIYRRTCCLRLMSGVRPSSESKPTPRRVPTANTVIRLIAKLGASGQKGRWGTGAKNTLAGMRDIATFVQGMRYARELELAG